MYSTSWLFFIYEAYSDNWELWVQIFIDCTYLDPNIRQLCNIYLMARYVHKVPMALRNLCNNIATLLPPPPLRLLPCHRVFLAHPFSHDTMTIGGRQKITRLTFTQPTLCTTWSYACTYISICILASISSKSS